MMSSDDSITGPINLGNPGEFTIGELADMVIDKTGTSSGIDYFPLPIDDPIRRQPDITKAKTILGWEPTIPLTQGLDTTIRYFKENVAT